MSSNLSVLEFAKQLIAADYRATEAEFAVAELGIRLREAKEEIRKLELEVEEAQRDAKRHRENVQILEKQVAAKGVASKSQPGVKLVQTSPAEPLQRIS